MGYSLRAGDGAVFFSVPAPHRLDESAAGYSLAGCTPAEPASASPAGFIFDQPAETVNLLVIPSSCRLQTNTIPPTGYRMYTSSPSRLLFCSFKRAILDQVLAMWFKQGLYRSRSSTVITREKNDIEQHEFDMRLLNFVSEGFGYLESNAKEWLKFASKPKQIADEMATEAITQRHNFVVLIDRLDDS